MSLDRMKLEVEKKYGKGVIQQGDEKITLPILSSTGSYTLDDALGCGGIPAGRIIELFGPPSGGKTTISIHMMREVQKVGHPVAFIDLENSFDPEWAKNIGIDLEKLFIVQPTTGDEAFDIMEMMVRDGEIKFIVLDSVSAIVTKAVLEGEYGDAHMAQTARLMSQGLAKLNAAMTVNDTTIAFINQIRNKIGGYGNPEETSGGNALKFYASARFDVRRKEVIGDKEDPDGFVTKIKLAKNKCGPPFRISYVDLYIGKEGVYGIDNFSEVVTLAVEKEIIKKGGAWFKFDVDGEEERFQGKQKVITYLKENMEIFNSLKDQVFSKSIIENKSVEGSLKDKQNEQAQEIVKKAEKVAEIKEEGQPKRRGRPKKEEPETEEMNIIEDVKGDSNEEEETKKED